jgi:hypothetical protein
MNRRRQDLWCRLHISRLSISTELLLAVSLIAGFLAGCGNSTGKQPHQANSRPQTSGPYNSRPQGKIVFKDMRPHSGISFRLGYNRRQNIGIKETIGHPAALLDADGDGLLDVLLAGPNRVMLFRNLGQWRFQPVRGAGFRQHGYWQGVAIGDVDSDSDPDIFLSGFGCSALYLNQGGGRFQDVTAASGLGNRRRNQWQTSAAFADVNRDGRLDLYVTCYVELGNKSGVCTYPGGVTTACSPAEFTPQRGTLYRNLGEVRFTDVTVAYGLDGAHGNGLGVAFGDPNADGYPDLYLANDERPCDLYINQQGRRFVNDGIRSGTAFRVDGAMQAGMGVDFGDYDTDGREDLVVTNYLREPTSLYHNEGGGLFTNTAYTSRLGPASTTTVGWGVKWTDLDNDGLLDLAIANGHPLHRIQEIDPSTNARQRFQIFRNLGHGLFTELPSGDNALSRAAIAGRALCVGDLDNDGKMDLLILNIEGQPLLLRNVSPTQNHWLIVRLVGRPFTEGALIVARAGKRKWMRRSTTGGSYLSASDPRVHFGLGEISELEEVQVRWPRGKSTLLKAVPADQEIVVRAEGF